MVCLKEWQLLGCQYTQWQQPDLTTVSLLGLVECCSNSFFLRVGKLSTKIFFTALAVLGLFTCFFGHRFWKTGTESFFPIFVCLVRIS